MTDTPTPAAARAREDIAAELCGLEVYMDSAWDMSLEAQRLCLAKKDALRAELASAVAPGQRTTCERCQGNGEIVTDWERYRNPHVGDVGDEAVSECPDCDGTGTVASAAAPASAGADDATFNLSLPSLKDEIAAEITGAARFGMTEDQMVGFHGFVQGQLDRLSPPAPESDGGKARINSHESAHEILGGLPVAAAESNAEQTGRSNGNDNRAVGRRTSEGSPEGEAEDAGVTARRDGNQAPPPVAQEAWKLMFGYTNWRGEISRRRVRPISLRFGASEWHPGKQWLLTALDLDKGEQRDFAMRDMFDVSPPDLALFLSPGAATFRAGVDIDAACSIFAEEFGYEAFSRFLPDSKDRWRKNMRAALARIRALSPSVGQTGEADVREGRTAFLGSTEMRLPRGFDLTDRQAAGLLRTPDKEQARPGEYPSAGRLVNWRSLVLDDGRSALTTEDVLALIDALTAERERADKAERERDGANQTADDLAGEAIWVICCSGMKFAVARLIQDRVFAALRAGEPVRSRFNHPGKAAAIEIIWRDRERLYADLQAANDKLAFCRSLPWIGGITQYHLAKNIGLDVAKPDVHLQRLADAEQTTVQALCERLARGTGYRVATVDLILWYACAHGVVDSRAVSAGISG